MDELIDTHRLDAWMARQDLGPGPIEDLKLMAGGTQNILLRFVRDGCVYVLRRPPRHPRNNSNRTMEREAVLLQALADTPVPHARLIASCSDHSVLGYSFYLMEEVQGFNPATELPELHAGSPQVRHRMGLALTEGIAALGELDYQHLGLSEFGKPENYLERQVGRWRSQLDSYADFPNWNGLKDLPGVDRVADWLDANRPVSFRPGIMHGDYHLANVMYRFDSAELAAIIDWELATIGAPLIDLGWLLATWPDPDDPEISCAPLVTPWQDFPTADELVEHYARHSSRDLQDLGWYRVLACYKLAILLEGTHARASAGKAPKDIGDTLHGNAVKLFRRALKWIG